MDERLFDLASAKAHLLAGIGQGLGAQDTSGKKPVNDLDIDPLLQTLDASNFVGTTSSVLAAIEKFSGCLKDLTASTIDPESWAVLHRLRGAPPISMLS